MLPTVKLGLVLCRIHESEGFMAQGVVPQTEPKLATRSNLVKRLKDGAVLHVVFKNGDGKMQVGAQLHVYRDSFLRTDRDGIELDNLGNLLDAADWLALANE